jgi:hypothetical protein
VVRASFYMRCFLDRRDPQVLWVLRRGVAVAREIESPDLIACRCRPFKSIDYAVNETQPRRCHMIERMRLIADFAGSASRRSGALGGPAPPIDHRFFSERASTGIQPSGTQD